MFGTLEPDVYFYGATIEKIGDDKYKITKGGFTTCVQPAPRWQIVSGSATVNLDDYVVMKNAVVQVKHVPVFYLPVLYYPIQDDDRATGFLIPFWGTSTYRGQSISNAFFWAINRSQDATLTHDWFFSRGQGMGAEYRYLLSPSAQGNFLAYWLDEKASVVNGIPSPERRSAKYTGGLSQGLPLGLTGRMRIEYFTDVTVQQLYNNNFFDASRSTRTIGGGVAGAWKGLAVNGNFQRTEYFLTQTDSEVQGTAPGLSISYSGRKLGPLPIYASINAEGGHQLYIRKSALLTQDLSLSKADLSPSLRAPLSTLPYLQVNTIGGVPHDLLQREPRRRRQAGRGAGDTNLRRPSCRRHRPGLQQGVHTQRGQPPEARHRAVVLGAAHHRLSPRRTGFRRRRAAATTPSSAGRHAIPTASPTGSW